MPLIDLAQHLDDDVPGWGEPMHVLCDGMHVTDEGSRTHAGYISEALLPVVANARKPHQAPPRPSAEPGAGDRRG